MADPTRKKGVHVSMIIREHREACKKHPKFCDQFIDESGRILKVRAGVRYFEDGEVNGERDVSYEEQKKGVTPKIPCIERSADGKDYEWCINIDVDTGTILNWPKGNTAHVHYKVCDCCEFDYIVNGKKICDNESGKCCGYVPDILCPNGEGFGDYMIMDIDADGKIANWRSDKLKDWLEVALTTKD